MVHANMRHKPTSIRIIALRAVGGVAVIAVIVAGAVLLATNRASAKPEFAAQTGLPCGQCHTNPAGGGKLKAFGEKFKANGNKVKK
jgi:hypothetical protein